MLFGTVATLMDEGLDAGERVSVMTDPSDPGPFPKEWSSVTLNAPELSSPIDREVLYVFHDL